jgi:hypothetical protein
MQISVFFQHFVLVTEERERERVCVCVCEREREQVYSDNCEHVKTQKTAKAKYPNRVEFLTKVKT